jgi:protein-disulfide isomerase
LPRIVVGIAIAVVIAAAIGIAAYRLSPERVEDAVAPPVTPEAVVVFEDDFILGDPGAPVTMIEFASLTCPHCASFHRDILPQLKKDYIDTGKMRLVYRDFPTSPVELALAAAMLARCGGEDRFFGFVEVLYRSQERWSRSENPRRELEQIARMGGMSRADFDACVDDKALLEKLQARTRRDEARYGIRSAPSFILDGRKLSRVQTVENFRDVLDSALARNR